MAAKKGNVRFRLHPRVFAALGSDLVTNDLVAITELVKNAYDAFASRVDVRFRTDDKRGPYIEIQDDGLGMDRDKVQNVWCVVATPNRLDTPVARRGRKSRRVAGEKGLGRLSAARLGDELEMLTQAPDEDCLLVELTWSTLSKASDISHCQVSLSNYVDPTPFQGSGTLLRIFELKSEWTPQRLEELHEHLSRLISPFSQTEAFEVWLHLPDDSAEPAKIAAPDFLKHPKYLLEGMFTDTGDLNCDYSHFPIQASRAKRTAKRKVPWKDIRDQSEDESIKALKSQPCGPFTFEIRAWDIGTEDVDEIAGRFDIKKKILVRAAIRAHKGISVYRDGILVLPKSEGARDWLGLDLRRVSEVGTRLSTSQIIGYVAITAEGNSEIKDTSDRERLVESRAVAVFEEVIRTAVGVLERERLSDRLERKKAEQPLKDLFGELSADGLCRKGQGRR